MKKLSAQKRLIKRVKATYEAKLESIYSREKWMSEDEDSNLEWHLNCLKSMKEERDDIKEELDFVTTNHHKK